MPTDRDLVFHQWSFRTNIAVLALHVAARTLGQDFDRIGGSIAAEHAFELCLIDVMHLIMERDTEGILALTERIQSGTYAPFNEAAEGDGNVAH